MRWVMSACQLSEPDASMHSPGLSSGQDYPLLAFPAWLCFGRVAAHGIARRRPINGARRCGSNAWLGAIPVAARSKIATYSANHQQSQNKGTHS